MTIRFFLINRVDIIKHKIETENEECVKEK